jgi:hypothetical protein
LDTHLQTLLSALDVGVGKAIVVLKGWDRAVKDAVFEVLDTQQAVMAELHGAIPNFGMLLFAD